MTRICSITQQHIPSYSKSCSHLVVASSVSQSVSRYKNFRLCDVPSQKMDIFIVTDVRTTNVQKSFHEMRIYIYLFIHTLPTHLMLAIVTNNAAPQYSFVSRSVHCIMWVSCPFSYTKMYNSTCNWTMLNWLW